MLKDAASHAGGSLIAKAAAACTDGKDPAKDAAVGAGVVTAGIAGAAVLLSAPVTLPLLGIAAGMGAVIGFCSGQNKKNKNS